MRGCVRMNVMHFRKQSARFGQITKLDLIYPILFQGEFSHDDVQDGSVPIAVQSPFEHVRTILH